MKDNTSMTGKLLQGQDNAKDGIVIWADFDPKAGAVDVFFGGLSGETVEIKLPKSVTLKETDVKGKIRTFVTDTITLSKTLKLSYSIPGQAAARLHAPVKLISSTWVMR